ncbi:glycosyl hydrolase family 8 [Leptolyngbya ohadii]|uniref:glycosyl hydrolase family 8 n=1 Tax=Leptolyngbya ohadii TaxID=1962290 RepID=UPI000B5A0F09|nr:glycosyl hydrolase family 8 [Leptolyngbya ohadii]
MPISLLLALPIVLLLSSVSLALGTRSSGEKPGASQFSRKGGIAPQMISQPISQPIPPIISQRIAAQTTPTTSELLRQSWTAYKQRFIQADGRVIDWEANGRTVSEGQAYAMLRSVLANDPATFALTLQWAEQNLQRRDGNQLRDRLWAWKWGQNDQGDDKGEWGILDSNFASDADIDAATALILAARRWNRPEYLTLAQAKLKDIWESSTIVVNSSAPMRHLLPGPIASFQPQPDRVILNPSYGAPYAFRLFAQVDPGRDWMSLVESSYRLLEDSAALSEAGLPSDWVVLNLTTGAYEPIDESLAQETNLRSVYSFDAFRVWWRVALDATWFNEPRAVAYLREHLRPLQQQWRSNRRIAARIDLEGNPTVSYEATSQYAMLYPAMRLIDPALADEIRSQKLLSTYRNGIWDNDSAYYVQNLAWFGLFPNREVAASWLRSR